MVQGNWKVFRVAPSSAISNKYLPAPAPRGPVPANGNAAFKGGEARWCAHSDGQNFRAVPERGS